MEIEKEIMELKQTLERLENSIKANTQASLKILEIIRDLDYGNAYVETRYERCYVTFKDLIYDAMVEAKDLLNKLSPKSESKD